MHRSAIFNLEGDRIGTFACFARDGLGTERVTIGHSCCVFCVEGGGANCETIGVVMGSVSAGLVSELTFLYPWVPDNSFNRSPFNCLRVARDLASAWRMSRQFEALASNSGSSSSGAVAKV